MTREGFDPMVLRLLGIMRTLGHRNVLHLGHEITVPSPQSSSGVVLVIPHIPHSLADVTAHYDRLSVPFLRSVMLQVILAVRHYHLRGVVHGSPSRPSLILLQPNGHVLLAPSERTHVLGHVDLALRGAALDDDWMHVAQLLYSLFVTSTTSNSNSTNSNSHSTNSSSSSVFHYAVAVVPGLVELYAALQSRPVAIEAILQENEFLRGVVKVPVPEVPFSFSSLSSASSSSSSASTTSPSAVAAAASSMTTAPQMSLLVPPQWRHGSSPPPSGSPS
jgi:serine/threonine protein kinase